VTLLPVDFETDNLAERLDHEGFNAGARTVYVWEAVIQYLTEPAVRQTMAYLSGAATGSGLVFTFVRKDFLDGQAMYGAEPVYQDFVVKQGLWKFGLYPEEVAGFFAEFGWRECEQVGPDVYASVTLNRPDGRALRPRLNVGVYAER
jgi:methyltransferase (TIGR00027 family)